MAAAGGAIRAGKAFVEFILDDDKFKRQLQGFEGRMKAAGARMQQIGAAMSAAVAPLAIGFAAATKQFADFGSELGEAAQRTGASVEALAGLKFAAEQSGTNLSTVERAVKKMQVSLVAATDPANKFNGTLGALGLSLAQLQGLSPDQQFRAIASAIAGVPDPAQRAALAVQAFGKSGTQLLPMLADGADALDKFQERAAELGLVLSEEDVVAADSLGDSLDQVKDVVRGLFVQIGAAIADDARAFADWFVDVAIRAVEFIRNNKELVISVAKITAVVAAAGPVLYGLGAALTFIALHPIVAALTAIVAGVAWLTDWFGLGSAAADDFGKSLDGVAERGAIKAPGAPPRPQLASPEELQSKLQQAHLGAAAVQSAAAPPVMDSAGMSANFRQMIDPLNAIDRNTSEANRLLARIEQAIRDGGGSIWGAF